MQNYNKGNPWILWFPPKWVILIYWAPPKTTASNRHRRLVCIASTSSKRHRTQFSGFISFNAFGKSTKRFVDEGSTSNEWWMILAKKIRGLSCFNEVLLCPSRLVKSMGCWLGGSLKTSIDSKLSPLIENLIEDMHLKIWSNIWLKPFN